MSDNNKYRKPRVKYEVEVDGVVLARKYSYPAARTWATTNGHEYAQIFKVGVGSKMNSGHVAMTTTECNRAMQMREQGLYWKVIARELDRSIENIRATLINRGCLLDDRKKVKDNIRDAAILDEIIKGRSVREIMKDLGVSRYAVMNVRLNEKNKAYENNNSRRA